MWLSNLSSIIQANGGLKRSFISLHRVDELKWGRCVGTDLMGNQYYENNYYFHPRNRWVLYSDKYGYDYDGSQVHSNWFRWLHHMTDNTPEEIINYPWILPHEENPTGTSNEFVPYSTTKPKIIPWLPPNKRRK